MDLPEAPDTAATAWQLVMHSILIDTHASFCCFHDRAKWIRIRADLQRKRYPGPLAPSDAQIEAMIRTHLSKNNCSCKRHCAAH